MKRTTVHTSTSPSLASGSLPGALTFVLEKRDGVLEYNLDEVFQIHQISITGLDSGTYSVDVWLAGGVGYHNIATGKAETVFVQIPSGAAGQVSPVICEKIRVVTTAGSSSEDPRLVLTSLPAGAR